MLKFLSIRNILWLGILLFGASACKTDYEKLVARELESGFRQDSLFLGLYLGMSSKDFYAHCWKLNKDQVIKQGSSNISVLYKLTDLKDTADMNFYPTFENDSIYEMLAHVNYRGWAPWNTQLSNDTLVHDVTRMLSKWYGGDFLRIDFPDVGTVWVTMHKNRRILVSKDGESAVKVLFTDMLMERRIRKKPKDE